MSYAHTTALEQEDIGIATGNGTDVAFKSADIILVQSKMQAVRKLRLNLFLLTPCFSAECSFVSYTPYLFSRRLQDMQPTL